MIKTFIMGCLGLAAAVASLILEQNYLLSLLFALGGLFLFSVCIVKAMIKEMQDDQQDLEFAKKRSLTRVRYSINKNHKYESSEAELKAIHDLLENKDYAHLN